MEARCFCFAHDAECTAEVAVGCDLLQSCSTGHEVGVLRALSRGAGIEVSYGSHGHGYQPALCVAAGRLQHVVVAHLLVRGARRMLDVAVRLAREAAYPGCPPTVWARSDFVVALLESTASAPLCLERAPPPPGISI